MTKNPLGDLDDYLSSTVDVRKIPIRQIDIPDQRHRAVDEDVQEIDEGLNELAKSMAKIGQISPIIVELVDGRFELIAGKRRTLAARRLGWETIEAKVELSPDEMRKELIEIEENLQRRELTPYELGRHIQRREALLDTLGLRARSGQAKGETDTPVRTTDDLAKEMGRSTRSYQQLKKIGESVRREAMDELEGTRYESSTSVLLALSQIDDPITQRDIAKALREAPEKSANDAKRFIRSLRSQAEREAEEEEARRLVASEVSSVEFLQGDFKEIMGRLPSRSVDLICSMATGRANRVDRFDQMARCAERVLSDDGLVVIGMERGVFDAAYTILKRRLTLVDVAFVEWGSQGFDVTPVCVWARKERKVALVRSVHAGVRTVDHIEDAWRKLLSKLIEPSLVVLDPMAGEGAVVSAAWKLGAKASGIDSDAEKLTLARARVDAMQGGQA